MSYYPHHPGGHLYPPPPNMPPQMTDQQWQREQYEPRWSHRPDGYNEGERGARDRTPDKRGKKPSTTRRYGLFRSLNPRPVQEEGSDRWLSASPPRHSERRGHRLSKRQEADILRDQFYYGSRPEVTGPKLGYWREPRIKCYYKDERSDVDDGHDRKGRSRTQTYRGRNMTKMNPKEEHAAEDDENTRRKQPEKEYIRRRKPHLTEPQKQKREQARENALRRQERGFSLIDFSGKWGRTNY